MSKKEPLFLKLTPQIIADFRFFIVKKYGKYQKGLLSSEVEEALRHWIGLHTNTQKIEMTRPTSKLMVVWSEIRQYLLSNYYQEIALGSRINDNHLRKEKFCFKSILIDIYR